MEHSANYNKGFATICFNLFTWQIVWSIVTLTEIVVEQCLLYLRDVTVSRLSTRPLA